MFKKVLLSIIIILPILALGIRLFENGYVSPSTQESKQTEFQPIYPSRTPANVPQTKLRFTPAVSYLEDDGTIEAEVFLDAFENNITDLRFEIGYDPEVFQIIEVKPVDFLGGKTATVNAIDTVNGKIMYGVKIDTTQTPPISGSDAVLEIELRPINKTVKESELKILPGTTITAVGITGNALVSAENAKLILTPQ